MTQPLLKRHLLALLGLLLGVLNGAHAETTPAIQVDASRVATGMCYTQNGYYAYSKAQGVMSDAECRAVADVGLLPANTTWCTSWSEYNSSAAGPTYVRGTQTAGWSCWNFMDDTKYYRLDLPCEAGATWDTTLKRCRKTGCPDASWTLQGTTCTRPDCATGQFRDASGVCRDSCPAGTTWSNASGGCACPL